jgi:DNA primase catalytic core
MITQASIDTVISTADIVREVERAGVKLSRSGSGTWKGCCPFHEDKTPSFTVYEKTQSYHCFGGCGASGNVVTFIKTKYNCDFQEAIVKLASFYSITLEFTKSEPKDVEAEKEAATLKEIYKCAAAYFLSHLTGKANEYALSRFSDKILPVFKIGYAPDEWQGLWNYLKNERHIPESLLIKSDLFRQNKTGGYYDFFRGRLMFPIFDRVGDIIAFSGRDTSGQSESKYLNSSETILYKKKETLFGLNFAIPAIRKYDVCVIVEGNADVVKLHQLGITNTVATCGTALSSEHIKIISRYTKNICLLFDGDKAGKEATKKCALKIIEAGLNCSVFPIPDADDGSKRDPDSYFRSQAQFAEDYEKLRKDYVLILAEENREKCVENPATTSKTMLDICRLFYKKSDQERAALIEQLAKIIPSRSLWNKTIKELDKETEETTKQIEISGRTKEQNEYIGKYGFYIENNCYRFIKNEQWSTGSNFIMEPLFHLESTYAAKRLYKLTNIHGVTRVIEFPQKDLIALSQFRLRCESMGNFRFDGGEVGLAKIKAYLYEKTKTCLEVQQLGWQRQGFWAWCNGSFSDNSFSEIDEYGIVQHNKENYYLPALSNFYKTDVTLFDFERKFVHAGGDISLDDWLKKFLLVYDKNALIAFGFYVATLFRDYIFSQFKFFPILNIFGPKGTGKSQLAYSLLQLFGKLPGGPNMTNSTIASLADHVSKTSNAVCHIEEYKNSVEYEKVEFLKGLWDGTGRSRMNMDKDKKKEVTNVDCGIVLTGQEMPTADIALFSRVIFLSFNKTEFSDAEKQRFNEFEAIQRKGLTQITNEILTFRAQFIEHFKEHFDAAHEELKQLVDESSIETRLWRNWLIIVGSIRTLYHVRGIPINYHLALDVIAPLIYRQHTETRANNDVSNFWDIFVYLVTTGILEHGYHYKIYVTDKLKTDKYEIEGVRKYIAVDMKTALQEYSAHSKRAGIKPMPISSLDYYLKNVPEFLGTQSCRLKVSPKNKADRTQLTELTGYGDDEQNKVASFLKRCHYYDYDKLNLDIESVFSTNDEMKG